MKMRRGQRQSCHNSKSNSTQSGKFIKLGKLLISKIFLLRSLVTVFLVLTTVLVSYYTFSTLTDSERKLYESQYESYSSQALQTAFKSAQRTSDGGSALARQFELAFPYAEQWPFVALPNYDKILLSSQKTWDGAGSLFSPRVQPSQLPEFNAFMNNFYATKPQLTPPPGGFVVTKSVPDPVSGALMRAVEITGETYWGSPFTDIFPLFQSSSYAGVRLGLNAHSELPYAKAIDATLQCAISSPPEKLADDSVQCGTISDIVSTPLNVVDSVIIHPIYPENNGSLLVGQIYTALKWSNILTDVVPITVSGLDFVVHSSSSEVPSITYTIKNGVPVYLGAGDQHDRKYDQYKRSRALNLNSLALDANRYTITMYPRAEFIDTYKTDNPWNFTIQAVSLIALTCLIFFVYDRVVKRDSSAKEELLQTKQQFVRYISHEVRTPLNAMAMGLKLLESELEAVAEDEEGSDQAQSGAKAAGSSAHHDSSLIQLRKKHIAQVVDWQLLTKDITENTCSAVFVLDDLLNYDKIETGSLRLELKEVDIWDLVRKTVHTFELAAKQVKVNLVLHVEQRFEGVAKAAPRKVSPVVLIEGPSGNLLPSAGVSSTNVLEEGMIPLTEPELPRENKQQEDEDQLEIRQQQGGALAGGEEDVEAGISSRHPLQPTLLHGSLSLQQQQQQQQQQEPIYHLPERAGSPDTDWAVRVLGDGTRLAQVVRNLISNALKFTPEQGRVTVKAVWGHGGVPAGAPRETVSQAHKIEYARAGSVRISVTDTGAGLSEEQLANICSEGVQFNANQLQGGRGSGLGLYISKGIVEQHGGTMVVTSEGLGHGTTFTVDLPLYLFPSSTPSYDLVDQMLTSNENSSRLSASVLDQERFSDMRNFSDRREDYFPRAMSNSRRDSLVSLYSQQSSKLLMVGCSEDDVTETGMPMLVAPRSTFPKNVLVVDDAYSNRKMLIRLLSRKGCHCVEARDGQEAVAIFKRTVGYIERAGDAAAGSRSRPMHSEVERTRGVGEEKTSNTNAADDPPPLADFDAIMMDFEMPVLNGPDATKLLRQLGCRCLILGITGNVLPADMKHFIDHGADAVLPKPLQLPEVVRAWQNHSL